MESETKSQLVTEICNISNNATTVSCAHRRHNGRNSINYYHFIDWYLILRVHENAEIEIIRKRYLRLALLLHPDKNSHPKAELAFNLVYEAYICLSDKAKRKTFDLERVKIVCIECNNNDSILAFKTNTKTHQSTTSTAGVFSSKKGQNQMLQKIKDLKIRFGKETAVIENCLRAYAPPRRSFSSVTKTEYPIFNPPDLGPTYYKNNTSHERYTRMQSKKILTSRYMTVNKNDEFNILINI